MREPAVARLFTGPDGLREMVSLASYVVSILPATPATTRVFDQRIFAAMRPGAYFINVGRGNSVDEDALVQALDSGHLSGAALDVFQHEPLPPHSPLWSARNLLLTPHVSGPIVPDEVSPCFLDNIERYLEGKPLQHVVNRDAGY